MIERLKEIPYEKISYYFVLLFAFLLPLSRASISFFIVLLPLLWIFSGNYKKKLEEIKESRVLLSIIALIVWSALSMLWAEDTKESLHMLRLNAYMFAIFPIALMIKKEQIGTIISAFLTGMFVSEIIAYGVFFHLWTFKHATPSDPTPFMFHIEYSIFLALTSIVLLNRLFAKRYTLIEKIPFAIFFFTVTGNLFITAGRTGQVAFFVAIVAMIIIHFRMTIKAFFISMVLIFGIFFGAYYTSHTFKVRVDQAISDLKGIIYHQNFSSSLGIRAAFWILTYDSLKEHPFGSGIGDYKIAIKQQLEKKGYHGMGKYTRNFLSKYHPHNQYLLYILEMGFIGVLLYLNLLYQILRLEIEDRDLKEMSILFVVIYGVGSLAEPLLIKQFTLALFVLLVGVFVAGSRSKKVAVL